MGRSEWWVVGVGWWAAEERECPWTVPVLIPVLHHTQLNSCLAPQADQLLVLPASFCRSRTFSLFSFFPPLFGCVAFITGLVLVLVLVYRQPIKPPFPPPDILDTASSLLQLKTNMIHAQ